jgi:protein KRI1
MMIFFSPSMFALFDVYRLLTMFFNSYILNRGWIDKEAKKKSVPSYTDIVGEDGPSQDKKPKKRVSSTAEKNQESEDLSEEEEFDNKADEFEARYNFRFEDPSVTLFYLGGHLADR